MNDKIHQDKPSPELIKMISYGHAKEKSLTEDVFDACYATGLEPLTSLLANLSEADLSHVLNTLVRQTKIKKAELEAKKK